MPLRRRLPRPATVLLTGVLADAFGLSTALGAIGGLTVLSALVIARRMYCLPEVGATLPPAAGCGRPGLPLISCFLVRQPVG